MTAWQVVFFPEALKDFRAPDHTQQALVSKAIEKVSQNPLSQTEGGYGKPLIEWSGIRASCG